MISEEANYAFIHSGSELYTLTFPDSPKPHPDLALLAGVLRAHGLRPAGERPWGKGVNICELSGKGAGPFLAVAQQKVYLRLSIFYVSI